MKIAYLSNSIIPSRSANSIHVMKMCQAFAKAGHEVALFAHKLKKKEIKADMGLYDFYGVRECFRIKKVWTPCFAGCSFICAIFSPIFVKKYNPDIVYSRFLKASYVSALLGLPVIHESHCPEKRKIDKFFISYLIKRKRIKKLVVISRALADYYKQKYPYFKENLVLAPDGADPVNSDVNSVTLKGDNKRLNIGYVGHMYKGRGVEIISKLIPKCAWAHFHFLGGEIKDIELWKKEISHYKNVTFYGHLSHSIIGRYMTAFDILIAPYQRQVSVSGGRKIDTAKWMSPLKIFEYMAAGKAILASDLPALKEVLVNERNSLLCAPEDINSWVNALNRLKNKEFRESLGQVAKKDFLEKYSWDKRAKVVLEN